MVNLTIEKRQDSARATRAKGKVPAVFYGPKAPTTSISINEVDFLRVWRQAGESSIITLQGIDEDHDALIHDIDKDPVTGKIRHADFYVIEKGKKVKVGVPLEFIGVSAAVKDLGGSLIKVVHEIEIEALPKDLPHNLEIDISLLVTFADQIKAGDIKLPAGVMLVAEADEVIALVDAPRAEVEEEVAPVDLSAIELSEKKGKKEEDAVAETPAA
ncbi:MAG: 50S ribosomal protein L25 [Patescibacteria group bacterium]